MIIEELNTQTYTHMPNTRPPHTQTHTNTQYVQVKCERGKIVNSDIILMFTFKELQHILNQQGNGKEKSKN